MTQFLASNGYHKSNEQLHSKQSPDVVLCGIGGPHNSNTHTYIPKLDELMPSCHMLGLIIMHATELHPNIECLKQFKDLANSHLKTYNYAQADYGSITLA